MPDVNAKRDITVRLRNWCAADQIGGPTGISVAACPFRDTTSTDFDPDLGPSCYYLWRWRDACPCTCTGRDANSTSGALNFRITAGGLVETATFGPSSTCLTDDNSVATKSFWYEGTGLRMLSNKIQALYDSATPGANATFGFDEPGDDVLNSYVCKLPTPVQSGVYNWEIRAWGVNSLDSLTYSVERNEESGFRLETSSNSTSVNT